MAQSRDYWGWVRDASRAGINYGEVAQAGWGGVLLRADDPNLGYYVQQARNAGLKVGIWDVPRGKSAEDFARYMASYSRYNPDIYVPDIEVEGKGYQGTAPWDYNENFARTFRNLLPDAYAAVTMEGTSFGGGLQDDYNYGAYANRGFEIWPQAYSGDMKPFAYDPDSLREAARRHGLDPDIIAPVMAPGQTYGGMYSGYTLDDLVGHGYRIGAPGKGGNRPPARQPASDGPFQGQGSPKPAQLGEDISLSGDNKNLPDKHNPLAIKYANKRLAQALATGLIKSIPKGDPTAAWRQVSQGVRPAAQQQFMSPEEFLRNYRPGNDVKFY